MSKKKTENKLESVEESLDRIACSLASISGVLDNFYLELMKEKREEGRQKEILANEPPFDHEGR